MENLVMVIWLVLYPMGCSISSYYNSKKDKITGDASSKEASFLASLINVIIWIYVAKLLYQN